MDKTLRWAVATALAAGLELTATGIANAAPANGACGEIKNGQRAVDGGSGGSGSGGVGVDLLDVGVFGPASDACNQATR